MEWKQDNDAEALPAGLVNEWVNGIFLIHQLNGNVHKS